MRRRRKEQFVLETAAEVANGARELRLDPVAATAGGSSVVRLVEDEQRRLTQQRAGERDALSLPT